ncbi:MAG: Spy/CpxP family protein refolding chaperone, partial [Cyanobacteria bacterium P01_D01_bin.56]
GVLMLTAVIGTTAILKAGGANAFPPGVAEELNVTPEQQAELDAIRENAHSQMDTVLTDDQLATLEGTTGRDRKRAMRQLDLSEEQRTQIRSIRQDSRAAVEEVLTDEQQAQLQAMKEERHERRKNRREDFAAELNLTPEQQSELDAIKENARTQAEAVLTADQQAAVEGKTGREWMQAMRSLDLSEEQRTQLRDIRESSRTAADDVLTDEQQAQLQEMREQRGNRRSR